MLGGDILHRELSDLIGTLSTRSNEISTRSARNKVRLHHTATKTMHNSLVGEIRAHR